MFAITGWSMVEWGMWLECFKPYLKHLLLVVLAALVAVLVLEAET